MTLNNHVSRHWFSRETEDRCPCPQAPCGFVPLDQAADDCDQHPLMRGKTIRAEHSPEECPGARA